MKSYNFVYNGKKYGLRAVNKDGTSYNGFQNNLEIGGVTTAPDWSNNIQCGGGIHFWPLGIGRFSKEINDPTLLWVVISYEECVDLGSKCKAPSVITEFVGNQAEAMLFLQPMILEYTKNGAATNSGHGGVATNSAICGVATNSGHGGVTTNSGHSGVATNSGLCGVVTNSGTCGVATNSGNYGVATNSGTGGAATNSGDSGVAINHGFNGIAASTGYRSQVFAEHGIACTTDEHTLLGGKEGVSLLWHTTNGIVHLVVNKELEGKKLTLQEAKTYGN